MSLKLYESSIKSLRRNPLVNLRGAQARSLASTVRSALLGTFAAMNDEAARRVVDGMRPVPEDWDTRWTAAVVRAQANPLYGVGLAGAQQARRELESGEKASAASAASGDIVDPPTSTAVAAGGDDLPPQSLAVMSPEDKFILEPVRNRVDGWLDEVASPTTKTHAKKIQQIHDEAAEYWDPDKRQGMTPEQIARRIEKLDAQYNPWRARMIAYTDTNWSYNAGAREFYKNVGVEVMEWMTSADDAVCLHCLQMDGAKVQISDPFWAAGSRFDVLIDSDGQALTRSLDLPHAVYHPPLHPHCFTPETPVLAPGKFAALVTAYNGPIVEIGFADGRRLSVTPNHMFLTPTGFASAALLGEGDKILDGSGVKWGAGSNPDDDGEPTAINQVVTSLSEARGMSSTRVPVAPEHLHGDAAFTDGYIDVIAPDSLLNRDFEAFTTQARSQLGFSRADVLRVLFDGEGNLPAMLFALGFAADGGVSGRSPAQPFLRRELPHGKLPGLRPSSRLDTAFNEPLPDRGSRNSMRCGKGLFGFPGDVSLANFFGRELFADASDGDALTPQYAADGRRTDSEMFSNLCGQLAGSVKTANVASVRLREFCGHVYDLQSASSLYLANGLVASNCACVLLPTMETVVLPVAA